MSNSIVDSLFYMGECFTLISEEEYAPAPRIDGIRIGEPDTYPPGWQEMSSTSSENLVDFSISRDETDWSKFDDLDSLCVSRQYIAVNISQVSMTKETFARTFGSGSWDEALGAYRTDGLFSPSYRSLLFCFFDQGMVMGQYFSRVKFLPGETLLKPSFDYFMEIPISGYVQEPVATAEGKYAIYPPRKRM